MFPLILFWTWVQILEDVPKQIKDTLLASKANVDDFLHSFPDRSPVCLVMNVKIIIAFLIGV